jgi:branched-chain amino acid transport system permease protein
LKNLSQGRIWAWIALILVVILIPLPFRSDFALSICSKIGIAVIFALSYNLLLGQGGMLSFGHAVYAGLGGYFTIHALAAMGAGSFYFPVSLLPLVGGLAGMAFALLLGYVCTGRAGTPFAMISLGIVELVSACVLMLPAFFGGEAGVAANRVVGSGVLGITFGSQREVYYLIAAWMLACVGAMYYLTRTPFGRMANAVRDNSARVGFIGYSTHLLRFQVLVISAAFAGISGGLAAINNEIVTVESVGVYASGNVLLMVFIGGVGHFVGPIIGAVIVTLLQTLVSAVTNAWQFYFGLLFLCMVLFAPGGFASLFATLLPPLRSFRTMRLVLPGYLEGLAGMSLLLAAIVITVESVYHIAEHSMNSEFRLLGQAFENGAAMPLGIALALAVFGIAATRAAISRTADARAVLGTQDLLHGTPKPQAAHAATRAQGWQA